MYPTLSCIPSLIRAAIQSQLQRVPLEELAEVEIRDDEDTLGEESAEAILRVIA